MVNFMHLMYPAVKVSLQDLAYTLSEKRTHHFVRGFAVTQHPILDPSKMIMGKKLAQPPRIGFVFTGQGAQWPQMGKLLIEQFSLAADILRQLDAVLQSSLAPPTWSLIGRSLGFSYILIPLSPDRRVDRESII